MQGWVVTQNGKVPKSTVGNRTICFSCENPFYDLNRKIVTCPVCDVDQAQRPEPVVEEEEGEE